MADVLIDQVGAPAAKCILKKLWQALGYMCCYKSNIKDLNKQVQQLRHKRDGIKLEEKSASQALKIIDGQVTDWLGDVDEIITEKEKIFSEESVAAKAACCNGRLPNLKGRFSLGRKAKEMVKAVDDLRAKDLGIIAHPAPHPEVEFQPTDDSVQLGANFHEGASSSGTSNHEQPPASQGKNIYFESRRSTIADVMEALRGSQINPIIICGMGGIGKTTLMGQVHEKAKAEDLFYEYTQATFKESLEVIQIQSELAEYLGLPLEEKERGPRANKLRQRLSQGSKKILVMLDNVWTTTPNFLWDIGIPPSCKLLVTSRQQDLFKDMDTRKNFPIHSLLDTEAWSLFKKTAGSSIESDPELHEEAEKILKECAGLPIAISTVGTALEGESIGIWKEALKELEMARPENVPRVIEDVYGPIKFSYQRLPGEEAKSCFLMCCLFEESADIQIEDLVRYGLGLELYKGIDSMVEGRNRVETLVNTLKSRFLLLDGDEKESVRMHDVVRDVALHIASEEFAEKKDDAVGKRIVLQDRGKTLQLIDRHNREFKSSADCRSVIIAGRCVLLEMDTESELPPTIFKRMEDLKVLVIQGTSLLSLAPSLKVLTNLRSLRLDWCSLGSGVSVIGELTTLMMLSLCGSDIEELPDAFKTLSDLRLLDLSHCRCLKKISPGVISSFTRLEELRMLHSSYSCWFSDKLASSTEATSRWKAEMKNVKSDYNPSGELISSIHTRWANCIDWESGVLAELLSLTCLTTLQVVLPPLDHIHWCSNLFKKLERFFIAFYWKEPTGGVGYDYACSEAKVLKTHNLDPILKLLHLKITNFLELTNVTDTQLVNLLDTVCFSKIKHLKLNLENDVEYLIDTTRVKPTTTPHDSSSSAIFPLLSSLKIQGSSTIDANWLKVVFHGELPTGSLNELRSLKLYRLPTLTHIWKINCPSEWGSWRNILRRLQELEIDICEYLEGFVAFEYENEQVIDFQSLTRLSLKLVPNFTITRKIISKGQESRLPEHSNQEQYLFDTKVNFPILTHLDISYLNSKEMWNDQLSTESFCELKWLKVTGCHELLHLVPTHMQNRLHKLEYLEVWDCSSLKEIFEIRRLIVDDEGEAAGLTYSESGNQRMQINKMMSFKQSHQPFQNLTEILIFDCASLRTLFSPTIARGLMKLQSLGINNCMMIEEIVAAETEGEETEDKNMFPKLCTLTLEHLPNLGSFSQGKYNFMWPLLEEVYICNCPNMKKFCLGSLSIPKEVNFSVEEVSLWQEFNDCRSEI